MAERLFVGLEYTNIEKFQSCCCHVGLSIKPLSQICCGECGKVIDEKALMIDYKPIKKQYVDINKLNDNKINLHNITDATIWVNEWLKTIKEHPEIPTDKETMIGWFANAIMAGYDAGRQAGESLKIDKEPCHGIG